jgi:hypothetical protein
MNKCCQYQLKMNGIYTYSPSRELKKQKGKANREQQSTANESKSQLEDEQESDSESKPVDSQLQQAAPPKRGQKHKLKKMKDKYKDQDEEERLMRMELLASAGTSKDGKAKKGKKGKQQEVKRQTQRQTKQRPQENDEERQTFDKTDEMRDHSESRQPGHEMIQVTDGGTENTESLLKDLSVNENSQLYHGTVDGCVKQHELVPAHEEITLSGHEKVSASRTADVKAVDLDDDDEQPETTEKDTMDYLNSLTGCPQEDDILLFAIPVCAPYSVMVNYKYRVKLTPGQGKRGKAARTALHMFMQDKSTLPREKDVLRSIKAMSRKPYGFEMR